MGAFVEGDLHLDMDVDVSKPIDFHLLFLSFLSYFYLSFFMLHGKS
jgi:hypothetical protein